MRILGYCLFFWFGCSELSAQVNPNFDRTPLAVFWSKIQGLAVYRHVEGWGRTTQGQPNGPDDRAHLNTVQWMNIFALQERQRLEELYAETPRATPGILEIWKKSMKREMGEFLKNPNGDPNFAVLAPALSKAEFKFARSFESLVFTLGLTTGDRGFSGRLMIYPDDRELSNLVINGLWGSVLTMGGLGAMVYGGVKGPQWLAWVGAGITIGWLFFSRWTIVLPSQNFPAALDQVSLVRSKNSPVANFLAELRPDLKRAEALRSIFKTYLNIRIKEIQAQIQPGAQQDNARAALSALLKACR